MSYDHPAAEALIGIIEARINSHPRSQQVKIGPSEIGHPCARWLAYKLADVDAVNPRSSGWRPTVGTAVHSWLAKTFKVENDRILEIMGKSDPVWLVEHRVAIGAIEAPDGYEIFGSCDIYFAPYRIVVDWKVVAKSTLDDVRRKVAKGLPPDEKYRIQVQGYGRGWLRAGMPVDEVAIFYLPASGELSDGVFWSQPFDETVTITALERVSAVQNMVHALGAEAAPLLPTVDHYCHRCEWFSPGSTDLTVGCPGDDSRLSKRDPVEDLI